MAETMDDDTSITESIVKYAERATLAESKVSNLEQRLAQLEVNSQMGAPPPNAAYYAPEAAYYTPQQYNQIPPTITVPPTQQQYGGQPTYQQPTYAPNKRKKRGGSRGGGGQPQMQFGQSPNVYRPPPHNNSPHTKEEGDSIPKVGEAEEAVVEEGEARKARTPT